MRTFDIGVLTFAALWLGVTAGVWWVL